MISIARHKGRENAFFVSLNMRTLLGFVMILPGLLSLAGNVAAQSTHIVIPARDSSVNHSPNLSSSILFAPSLSFPPAANNLSVVAPNAYTNHLGFFCRQELRTDKITPLPVRFRVGSMEQCNWLEQKPGATLPQR